MQIFSLQEVMAAVNTPEPVKLEAIFDGALKWNKKTFKDKGTLTWWLELELTDDDFCISAFFKGASKMKISIEAEFKLLYPAQEPLIKEEKKDFDCTNKRNKYEVRTMFTEDEAKNRFENGSDLRFEVDLTIVKENNSEKSSVEPKPEAKQEPTVNQ
ncbi:MATH (Meprin-associated Traf homology) domain containing [Caenorhabditis elegans]|uniref:MATH (Meprin-associated Traf homology) domain containing n=1 Tax=Caenorhabditis elegans TaxID=6239 RepID=P91545_CAEEL|nr:MATH (Meprin-associated Traf homology) domain containing [Caenorhabditis elegans]CCD63694.1 MATH (Meprin-associated Traf homology) domain containing [Caenorhabditis elegans]|eukprot:NP_494030.1 Uncharacterized protein CELE_ZC204.13 [Caenorhabditis elegans]